MADEHEKERINYRKEFRVAPRSKIRLKEFDPRFAEKCGSKRSTVPKIEKLQQRMDKLQFQLYAEQKHSLLIVCRRPTQVARMESSGMLSVR